MTHFKRTSMDRISRVLRQLCDSAALSKRSLNDLNRGKIHEPVALEMLHCQT